MNESTIRQQMVDRLAGRGTVSWKRALTLEQAVANSQRWREERAARYYDMTDQELFDAYTERVYEDGKDSMQESIDNAYEEGRAAGHEDCV